MSGLGELTSVDRWFMIPEGHIGYKNHVQHFLDQFRVGAAEDAEAAEIAAARQRAQSEASERAIRTLINDLALVAGVGLAFLASWLTAGWLGRPVTAMRVSEDIARPVIFGVCVTVNGQSKMNTQTNQQA